MSKLRTTLAVLLTFTATLPAVAQERLVYKRGEIFQNVAAEHVRPLLANTARVTQWWDGQNMEKGGYVRIVWYGADGREHGCLMDAEGNTEGWASGSYSGYQKDFKVFKVRYPLKEARYDNGNGGFQLLRYNGATGQLSTYLAVNRRWLESDVGHLQAKIPAVTWEVCPNFPSAESLGAQVNNEQTSMFYKELVAQDPGKRILRPQYQDDHAHEWYGRKAGKNKK